MTDSPLPDAPFKVCPSCGYAWPRPAALLADPGTQVCGYQANLLDLGLGLFLFNHLSCGTTFGIHARHFAHLHQGPLYAQQCTDTEDCPGYCQHPRELRDCQTECECQSVRKILQVLLNWKKTAPAP